MTKDNGLKITKVARFADANGNPHDTPAEARAANARIAIERWVDKHGVECVDDDAETATRVRVEALIANAAELAGLLRTFARMTKAEAAAETEGA